MGRKGGQGDAIPGEPTLPLPEEKSLLRVVLRPIILTTITMIAVPLLTIFFVFKGSEALKDTVRKVFLSPALEVGVVKSRAAQEELWASEMGRVYAQSLEYQKAEGYCSNSTMRNVLKSYNVDARHKDELPVPMVKRGPDTPEGWIKKLQLLLVEAGQEGSVEASVVRGRDTPQNEGVECSEEDHYQAFLEALKLSSHPSGEYRVCVNYLRSALLGPANYWPSGVLLSLFGGHFSPVVGMVSGHGDGGDPLCAVFDINHKYGLCIVPARRLFQAVRTYDIMTGKPRGLIVTKRVTGQEVRK